MANIRSDTFEPKQIWMPCHEHSMLHQNELKLKVGYGLKHLLRACLGFEPGQNPQYDNCLRIWSPHKCDWWVDQVAVPKIVNCISRNNKSYRNKQMFLWLQVLDSVHIRIFTFYQCRSSLIIQLCCKAAWKSTCLCTRPYGNKVVPNDNSTTTKLQPPQKKPTTQLILCYTSQCFREILQIATHNLHYKLKKTGRKPGKILLKTSNFVKNLFQTTLMDTQLRNK